MKKINSRKSKQSGFGVLTIVIMVAVVLGLGATGYFVATSSNSNNKVKINMDEDVAESNNEASVNASTTVSIKNLLALGKSLSCTFSRVDASNTTSGTIYIYGGQFRGDFNTQLRAGGNIESHIIQKGDKNYLWSSAQGNQGIVMTIAPGAQQGQGTTTAQSSVNVDEALDYKCVDWTPDSSRFTPPSTIKFTDLQKLLP